MADNMRLLTPDDYFHRALGRFVDGCTWIDSVDTGHVEPSVITEMHAAWDYLKDNLTSPIELILGAELLVASHGYGGVRLLKEGERLTEDFGVFLCAQELIEDTPKKMRVDFFFLLVAPGGADRLVVECDGHDFHERTKEQAKKDRSRDRDLVTAGYTVLRFTGSEIYNNPQKCAAEVEDVLGGLMKPLVEGAIKRK